MKHQIDLTVDFDVDYEITRPRQPARTDEPASGPEFHVTRCYMTIGIGDAYRMVVHFPMLPEHIRESIEEAIVEEIDAGA